MLIYCSHKFGGEALNKQVAKNKIKIRQTEDKENTYISPIHAFSFLGYGDLGYDEEIKLCLDLLSKCDKLLVLSDESEGVKREIAFAKANNIPIEYSKKRNYLNCVFGGNKKCSILTECVCLKKECKFYKSYKQKIADDLKYVKFVEEDKQ